jgi:hypothetical protein
MERSQPYRQGARVAGVLFISAIAARGSVSFLSWLKRAFQRYEPPEETEAERALKERQRQQEDAIRLRYLEAHGRFREETER